jgi:hypothetical protein
MWFQFVFNQIFHLSLQEFLHRLIIRGRSLVKQWEELINESGYVENGSAKVDASHDIAKTSTNIVLTNLMGSSLSSKDLEAIDSNLKAEREDLESSDLPFSCEKFGRFRSVSSFFVALSSRLRFAKIDGSTISRLFCSA